MQIKTGIASNSLPDLQQARSRFALLLGSVYRQWRRQVDLSFKDSGLSDATRMPLLVLYAQGHPMRQKDLAQALYLDTSSLVRVLAILREEKLVAWAASPSDRRTKCISLTPDGCTVASSILSKSLEIERDILAGLSTRELEVTRGVLEKISQGLDALGK